MPTFSSRSTGSSPLLESIRRRPFLFFGLPFLSIVVVSSFALQSFTRTRYDLNDSKVQTMTMEEGLGMSKDRKRVDIREEYYRLNAPASSSTSNDDALDAIKMGSINARAGGGGPAPASSLGAGATAPAPPALAARKKFSMRATSQDEYEPVRVPRPEGMPEWGAGRAGDEAPVKGQRKEDRWV